MRVYIVSELENKVVGFVAPLEGEEWDMPDGFYSVTADDAHNIGDMYDRESGVFL